MRKCPICKVPLKENSYYDSDIHMTVENYENCIDGCKKYSYEYAYGSWTMCIGRTMLYGWHGDKSTRRKKRSFIYKQVVARLRKQYRKEKGK